MKRVIIYDDSKQIEVGPTVLQIVGHTVWPAPLKHQNLLNYRCSGRQGCYLPGHTTVAKLFKMFLFSNGHYFSGQSVSHPNGPNTWFNVFEDELQSSSNGSVKKLPTADRWYRLRTSGGWCSVDTVVGSNSVQSPFPFLSFFVDRDFWVRELVLKGNWEYIYDAGLQLYKKIQESCRYTGQI